MKYIVCTTQEPIHFSISGSRKFIIESVIPTQVSEEEYTVLVNRLGSQIKTVEVPGTVEATPEEVEIPAEVEATPVVETEVETPAEPVVEATPEEVPSNE